MTAKPKLVSSIPDRPAVDLRLTTEAPAVPPAPAPEPVVAPEPSPVRAKADTYFVGMEDEAPINPAILRRALPERFND